MVVLKYGSFDDGTSTVSRGSYGCCPFRRFLKLLPMFSHGLAFEVGDGSRIKFWSDLWCRERPLRVNFLEIFAMVGDPGSEVASNMATHGGNVVWQPRLR